jgi:hypothetical protein
MGPLLLAAHAFVDCVEAYDCRMLRGRAQQVGLTTAAEHAAANAVAAALRQQQRGTHHPGTTVAADYAGFVDTEGIDGETMRLGVARRWKCGRGGDFAVLARGLVCVGAHHSPGARLRFFHHDLRKASVAHLRPPDGGSRGGGGGGAWGTRGGGGGGEEGAPVRASEKWSREVGVSAVVVDEWQARVQGPPRGLCWDDDGGCCALFLDRHRLLVVE